MTPRLKVHKHCFVSGSRMRMWMGKESGWVVVDWRERVWIAEARRCDDCGKRRLTYQARDDAAGNDRCCAECIKRRLAAYDDDRAAGRLP